MLLVEDDQQRAYKRAFAATLVGKRTGLGSQKAMAKIAKTSEATYRRWEDPDENGLPDAYEIALLSEFFACDPNDLVKPEELSPREWALTKRAAKAAARGLAKGLRVGDEPS